MMEVLLAGRLNSCGFSHLPYSSLKEVRDSRYEHGRSPHLPLLPVMSNLQPKSRSWTQPLVRNMCCQPSKWFAPGSNPSLLHMGGCHELCQHLKSSYERAIKSPACHLSSSCPDYILESPRGTSGPFRSRVNQYSTRSLDNNRSSNLNVTRVPLYRSCSSSVRGYSSFLRRGVNVDVSGFSSSNRNSLQLSRQPQKIRRLFVCYADNGLSDDSSEMPTETQSSLDDEAVSSSSRLESWVTYLKQVDWMNIIFRWQKGEPLWKVPWTGQTIFQVMVLWFAAFWVMGSWIIPIAAQLAGFSRHSLSFRGQALYSLITDIAEGTVGIWILRRCLARFVPLPDGWFTINLKGKWLLEACWGCLLFPVVNKLSQLNLLLLPLPAPIASSYVEQSMMSRDPIATLLYAIVISVCAPVWEEVIFRGFLLPSMTRYLPLWGAISVSALAFALAHFSMQRILPLTFLGLVMGFVFVRSKNLLASIVLHSLWNGFAFLELL